MKVPYPMTAAMTLEERHQQMFHALQHGFPRLVPQPISEHASLSIACYGPSLLDTWRDLRPPILSMSGATRFLADRGIVADYHIDMDPRPHKTKHLEPPVDGAHYLMASVCSPRTWELLKGQRITLWHTYSGKTDKGYSTYDWVATHDPGAVVVHGGSTIGLTALHLAGVLGYRHLEVHGMDGNYVDGSRGSRHAGPHYGHTHKDAITWDAEGVTYHTSRIMSNAVAETINTVRNFPMFCVFHGHGLTQALVREANVPNACTADQTEKAATVRAATATVLDPRTFKKTTLSPWDVFLESARPEWVTELQLAFRANAARRAAARYDTGAVGLETALLLRALSAMLQPKVVIEVGTFIGNSAAALVATDHLYTCDRDNDCLPSTASRTCFPYTTSAQMFTTLAARGVQADLVFLDGRLTPADVPLLLRVTKPSTVYLFDDYVGQQKGVVNVAALKPKLPTHVLIPPYAPYEGRSTLAAMLPLSSAR